MTTTSYTEAREKLAQLLDRAVEDREVVIITRRGHEPVALIAADELASMQETIHLLRSPANALRLLESLARAKAQADSPTDLAALKAELGLDSE